MKVRQTTGMTIDDSERYLRLMLGGMKYAVKYWKDKDKEESDIEQTNVEAVETALDIMRKYQKIRERVEKLQKACDKDDLNLLAQCSAFGMVLDIIDEESEDEK